MMLVFGSPRRKPFEERVHFIIRHLLAKLRVDLFELFQQIDRFLDRLFHHFAHGTRIVNQRFLFEVADRVTGRDHRFAIEVLVDAREYPQQ